MRMTNLNDLDFSLCSLNDKESVLYTMMSLEDVIFPNGYVRYLMLSDGNDVVACLKPLEKYEMVGWIVAKGELPGTDGYFRIDKFDSYQSVSFNEWAYGEVTTTLLEGKIDVQYGNNSIPVLPGEEVLLDKVSGEIRHYSTDASQSNSWINGDLRFDSISLLELSKRLSRKYDVDIVLTITLMRKQNSESHCRIRKPLTMF